MTQRELVDEIAGLAEIAGTFIRDNLERDRDNFLTHLDEGQKIYRAVGDCAPAFGMISTLIGMVQMFANMTDPSKLGPFMATALLATLTVRCWRTSSACRSPTSSTASSSTRRSIAR